MNKYYIEKDYVCKVYSVERVTPGEDGAIYSLLSKDLEFLKVPKYCHISPDRKGWRFNKNDEFCYEIGFWDWEYFEFETDEEALLYEEVLDE